MPARDEPRRQLGREGPVCIQAIRSAVEGKAGLVLRYLGHEAGQLPARDVRRVAEDEVEGLGGSCCPIAKSEAGAIRHAERGCIALGDG